ncbi:hypothetical protein ACJJTC_016794 [Scirpophaga incertulas]
MAAETYGHRLLYTDKDMFSSDVMMEYATEDCYLSWPRSPDSGRSSLEPTPSIDGSITQDSPTHIAYRGLSQDILEDGVEDTDILEGSGKRRGRATSAAEADRQLSKYETLQMAQTYIAALYELLQ